MPMRSRSRSRMRLMMTKLRGVDDAYNLYVVEPLSTGLFRNVGTFGKIRPIPYAELDDDPKFRLTIPSHPPLTGGLAYEAELLQECWEEAESIFEDIRDWWEREYAAPEGDEMI